MKQFLNRIKTTSCVLLIMSAIAIPNVLFGQGKLYISGGFSTAELLNGGLRYKINQSQIGLSIGFIPVYSYKSLTLSGNFYYHFAGSSKLSDLRPWYGKSGILYLVNEDQYVLDKGFYLPFLIGRDFNISKKIGINSELGLGFLLFNERTTKKISTQEYGVSEAGSFPCFGIGCIYRI